MINTLPETGHCYSCREDKGDRIAISTVLAECSADVCRFPLRNDGQRALSLDTDKYRSFSTITPAKSRQKSVQHLKILGIHAIAVQGDETSAKFGSYLMSAGLAAFPNCTIDVWVNNAKCVVTTPDLESITIEDFDILFYANPWAPFLIFQAALPQLTLPRTRVINISTALTRSRMTFANLYSGSKAALNVMTLRWAKQLGLLFAEHHLPAQNQSHNCAFSYVLVFVPKQRTAGLYRLSAKVTACRFSQQSTGQVFLIYPSTILTVI
jgi:hypothetical protein